jgi:hypothetical protein
MADDIIWGYQRVADGDACQFCLMLDGAQFRTDSPMPIHPFCGCGVEPVEYTRLGKGRRRAQPDPPSASGLRGRAIPDEIRNLSNAPTATREAVQRAADQLDDAIKVSDRPSSLIFEPLNPGVGGQMAPATKAMSIASSEQFPARAISSVYHHEFGHFIDYAKLPAGSTEYFAAKAARKELLKVLRRTSAVKVLRDIAKTVSGGNKTYMTYLLSEDELIARAFQAWMSRKSLQGEASSRALWALMPDTPTNKRIARAMAFEDDDLELVEAAMRDWLSAKGFL